MTNFAASFSPSPLHADNEYPRPQLVRNSWRELDGSWGFAHDDGREGILAHWEASALPFDRSIRIPFPPESQASGIGDNGFHPVVWYRREVTEADVRLAGYDIQGDQMLLHFGAVDYRADVWLDGAYLGSHEGGHTPFSFDISVHVARATGSMTLVVRAEDDPKDLAQPRGKQDWELEPHGIWYKRTTGIWQPVWLEAVPKTRVSYLAWSADVPSGSVTLSLELNERPAEPVTVAVALHMDGVSLANVTFSQQDPRATFVIMLPHQTNGQAYEKLLWSPENPRLVTASITVAAPDERPDIVSSYFGIRSVGWSDGHFMLNDRPYYVRAVLEQGYWPDSHLAAPSPDALRAEVQLIKDLGFNAARIHEKVEDPRFLYWADKLGLMIWGESASAFEFSPTAIERSSREWIESIRRDVSHPSIVVWVPLNESWGVQHISHKPEQLAYARSLYHLTKALDPTRLVISNDGWEHADSDIWTVHDYGVTHDEVAANYTDRGVVAEMLNGTGPLGRTIRLLDEPDAGQPVIVSEFGGVSFVTDYEGLAWGYTTASSADEFASLVSELFAALQESPVLAGFCYTQLTDTLQETNGLTDANRVPKLPLEAIRGIVTGRGVDVAGHRRPKTPVEEPQGVAELLS
ncbi:glycoside hydrolase family 2 protein [Cryobacterium sp. TMT4-31]|uniref:glycoside hydrolase family 2 protein n=1 Tax=Cryobacterium sp. TMT4-31 TaxID=1259259 RepID=UPI0010694ED9|nr:glycoside hydrolase family 2 TIM barrel-domain containing protein [Cryobacterium sp. TMT4-31]TFC90059.1 glycoside hydrolase family 2 [Cryobacterium sp. TMT4-31]